MTDITRPLEIKFEMLWYYEKFLRTEEIVVIILKRGKKNDWGNYKPMSLTFDPDISDRGNNSGYHLQAYQEQEKWWEVNTDLQRGKCAQLVR